MAWAVSGSVGLELMAEGLPSVVLYKVKRFDLWVARPFIKAKYISLVNLLADDEVFPEYLTWRDASGELVRWALAWLDDTEERARTTTALDALRRRVARPGATDRAAERIVARLSRIAEGRRPIAGPVPRPARAGLAPAGRRRTRTELALIPPARFLPTPTGRGQPAMRPLLGGGVHRPLLPTGEKVPEGRMRGGRAVALGKKSPHSRDRGPDDQPRKTIAGSSDATLRNDSDAAPRQSTCVPTKTRAASVGETIIFMSSRARTGCQAVAPAPGPGRSPGPPRTTPARR